MEKKITEIKTLKKGSFVIVDDAPCRVDSLQTSKPGKHGGAKARLTAVGIFDNQKRVIVKPAGTKVDVPVIEKRNSQVIALIGDNAQLMDLADYTMSEVPVPEDLKPLKEGEEVIVWKYGNYVMIKSRK
jgi:translation initiation factor 5A